MLRKTIILLLLFVSTNVFCQTESKSVSIGYQKDHYKIDYKDNPKRLISYGITSLFFKCNINNHISTQIEGFYVEDLKWPNYPRKYTMSNIGVGIWVKIFSWHDIDINFFSNFKTIIYHDKSTNMAHKLMKVFFININFSDSFSLYNQSVDFWLGPSFLNVDLVEYERIFNEYRKSTIDNNVGLNGGIECKLFKRIMLRSHFHYSKSIYWKFGFGLII